MDFGLQPQLLCKNVKNKDPAESETFHQNVLY